MSQPINWIVFFFLVLQVQHLTYLYCVKKEKSMTKQWPNRFVQRLELDLIGSLKISKNRRQPNQFQCNMNSLFDCFENVANSFCCKNCFTYRIPYFPLTWQVLFYSLKADNICYPGLERGCEARRQNMRSGSLCHIGMRSWTARRKKTLHQKPTWKTPYW